MRFFSSLFPSFLPTLHPVSFLSLLDTLFYCFSNSLSLFDIPQTPINVSISRPLFPSFIATIWKQWSIFCYHNQELVNHGKKATRVGWRRACCPPTAQNLHFAPVFGVNFYGLFAFYRFPASPPGLQSAHWIRPLCCHHGLAPCKNAQ